MLQRHKKSEQGTIKTHKAALIDYNDLRRREFEIHIGAADRAHLCVTDFVFTNDDEIEVMTLSKDSHAYTVQLKVDFCKDIGKIVQAQLLKRSHFPALPQSYTTLPSHTEHRSIMSMLNSERRCKRHKYERGGRER